MITEGALRTLIMAHPMGNRGFARQRISEESCISTKRRAARLPCLGIIAVTAGEAKCGVFGGGPTKANTRFPDGCVRDLLIVAPVAFNLYCPFLGLS